MVKEEKELKFGMSKLILDYDKEENNSSHNLGEEEFLKSASILFDEENNQNTILPPKIKVIEETPEIKLIKYYRESK